MGFSDCTPKVEHMTYEVCYVTNEMIMRRLR
jgi:hypothetical protein